MQAELSGMLVITLMLGGWIGIVEWITRHTSISPEWSRKLVHLGGGAGCLLFPWLLSHPLAVLVLAVGFGASLWLAEKSGLLQSLCRVKRQSYGSLYYPFAIAALFWLTHDDYGLYMSAVLVLTVADTAAALVGARFGRVRFRTGGVVESKSLEGSIAFWVVTFLAVLLPLVLIKSDVSVMQSLLSAFLAATLLTMVEAVSIGGRDNLFVPLIAAFLLLKTVTKSTPELMMQSVSILILFALLPVVNRYGRLLRTKNLMIMSIILYGVWSLGSVDWAVPLLVAILVFLLVFVFTGGRQRRTLVYRRMVLLATPAATLMLLANLTGMFHFLYGLFLAAVLVPLVFGVVVQLGKGRTGWRWSWPQLAGGVIAVAAVLAEPVVMRRAPDTTAVWLLAGGVLLAVWLGIGIMTVQSHPTGGVGAFLTVLGAVIVVGVCQYIGIFKPWRPLLWADVYGREADVLLPWRPDVGGGAQ
ncbi:MAG: diacylglycerol/polyprenol kinase family protein [Verrucomicrobiota bacterium]|jgi:phytol kinase